MAKESTRGITHPTPTKAVVREVMGTALRCGFPDCQSPLYVQDNNTGKLTRNSEMAHIHAQSSGGPRWLEGMTGEENGSPDNLLMLCFKHHTLVDDDPDYYTASKLKEWKQAQVKLATESVDVPRFVPSDTQIDEMLSASLDHLKAVRLDRTLPFVRSLERFIATVEHERGRPHSIAADWKRVVDQQQRFAPRDIESGERVQVQPPRVTKLEYQDRIRNALTTTNEMLQPLMVEVRAELAAATSGGSGHETHSSWLLRSVDRVVRAATAWPTVIHPANDEELIAAVIELRAARDALLQHLRGEDAPEPPAVRSDGFTGPSELELRLEGLRQLLREAAPFRYASNRPFDRELHGKVIDETAFAAWMPLVLEYSSVDLWVTTETAAKILRKAPDDDVAGAIADYKTRRPAAAAVFLLFHLRSVLEEEERSELSAEAHAALLDLITGFAWDAKEVWAENEVVGERLMQVFALVTSAEEVRNQLERALEADPALSAFIIPAVAGWQMTLNDEWQFAGARRHFRELASWLPAGPLVTHGEHLSDELKTEDVEGLIIKLRELISQ